MSSLLVCYLFNVIAYRDEAQKKTEPQICLIMSTTSPEINSIIAFLGTLTEIKDAKPKALYKEALKDVDATLNNIERTAVSDFKSFEELADSIMSQIVKNKDLQQISGSTDSFEDSFLPSISDRAIRLLMISILLPAEKKVNRLLANIDERDEVKSEAIISRCLGIYYRIINLLFYLIEQIAGQDVYLSCCLSKVNFMGPLCIILSFASKFCPDTVPKLQTLLVLLTSLTLLDSNLFKGFRNTLERTSEKENSFHALWEKLTVNSASPYGGPGILSVFGYCQQLFTLQAGDSSNKNELIVHLNNLFPYSALGCINKLFSYYGLVGELAEGIQDLSTKDENFEEIDDILQRFYVELSAESAERELLCLVFLRSYDHNPTLLLISRIIEVSTLDPQLRHLSTYVWIQILTFYAENVSQIFLSSTSRSFIEVDLKKYHTGKNLLELKNSSQAKFRVIFELLDQYKTLEFKGYDNEYEANLIYYLHVSLKNINAQLQAASIPEQQRGKTELEYFDSFLQLHLEFSNYGSSLSLPAVFFYLSSVLSRIILQHLNSSMKFPESFDEVLNLEFIPATPKFNMNFTEDSGNSDFQTMLRKFNYVYNCLGLSLTILYKLSLNLNFSSIPLEPKFLKVALVSCYSSLMVVNQCAKVIAVSSSQLFPEIASLASIYTTLMRKIFDTLFDCNFDEKFYHFLKFVLEEVGQNLQMGNISIFIIDHLLSKIDASKLAQIESTSDASDFKKRSTVQMLKTAVCLWNEIGFRIPKTLRDYLPEQTKETIHNSSDSTAKSSVLDLTQIAQYLSLSEEEQHQLISCLENTMSTGATTVNSSQSFSNPIATSTTILSTNANDCHPVDNGNLLGQYQLEKHMSTNQLLNDILGDPNLAGQFFP